MVLNGKKVKNGYLCLRCFDGEIMDGSACGACDWTEKIDKFLDKGDVRKTYIFICAWTADMASRMHKKTSSTTSNRWLAPKPLQKLFFQSKTYLAIKIITTEIQVI